jgi:isohexenylglutaconyl-CoA hydratase
MSLPENSQTIRLERQGPVLHLTLARPERRNAMSVAMVTEIEAAFAAVEADPGLRIVVIRGAGGHFCAGGDVADMAEAAGQAPTGPPGTVGGDPIAAMNRRFGTMLAVVERSRAATVAVCEGGVMGGGFGLACVVDLTLAVEGASFRLPETSLGLIPAQIAPFVLRRLGMSQARRIAVTGASLGAAEAVRIGLAHEHLADADAVDAALARAAAAILRCEPGALAATRRLLFAAASEPTDAVLDEAALAFAGFARSPAAEQGFAAFLARRPPPWADG